MYEKETIEITAQALLDLGFRYIYPNEIGEMVSIPEIFMIKNDIIYDLDKKMILMRNYKYANNWGYDDTIKTIEQLKKYV
jgi:hypothetical protein